MEEAVPPASEVMKPTVVPVEETTVAVEPEPEPEVGSEQDLVHTDLSIAESVGVDATPSLEQVEPVVSREIISFPSPLTSIHCNSRSTSPRMSPPRSPPSRNL